MWDISFFEGVCSDAGISCRAAGGKSKVLEVIRLSDAGEKVLIVADGAAFGSEMDRVMKFIRGHENVSLYLPESL